LIVAQIFIKHSINRKLPKGWPPSMNCTPTPTGDKLPRRSLLYSHAISSVWILLPHNTQITPQASLEKLAWEAPYLLPLSNQSIWDSLTVIFRPPQLTQRS